MRASKSSDEQVAEQRGCIFCLPGDGRIGLVHLDEASCGRDLFEAAGQCPQSRWLNVIEAPAGRIELFDRTQEVVRITRHGFGDEGAF